MIKKMDKKAFTLIEVIVVVAIIGILVLLAVPRFTGHTQRAELARIQHDVKTMEREMGAEFINKDDDFDNWENNINDLNQLAQEDELFEKEGRVAKNGDPIDGTYKVIPEEYKDKINTKLKGTFYANSAGKVYYEHGKGPGYSDEEIQDKIAEGYIPVAAADELHNVRDDEINLFGKGTKWEKEYIGGLDKKYVQVTKIDLSGYSEEGWAPIGTDSKSFKGTYDGGSYVITDLEVKGDGKILQGLFGYTQGAIIRNVGLIDNKVTGRGSTGGLVGGAESNTIIENSYTTGSVTGGDYVGGLAGYASSGTTISNSYATGSVTGSGTLIGGLVGLANFSTTISNSYSTGSVTGKDSVGGLVGTANSSTTISNSYAKGSVNGAGWIVGGLVGEASTNAVISNSYATGSVTGDDNVGGLVGLANSSTIENSYSIGSVSGTRRTGGLVGVSSSSTINNSYWNKVTTGQSTSAGEGEGKSEGKSTDKMKLKDTYKGWGFKETWEIDEGVSYPTLINNPERH